MLLYGVVLGFLFRQSFKSDQVLFNNDGPLGVIMALADVAWSAFFGLWQPLNWIGAEIPSALPHLTSLIYFTLGPMGFAKFDVPIALLILGLSAWFLFRRLRFSPTVCLLGGLAAMLNMNIFSHACWGLSTRALTLALVFLAVAALVSGNGLRGWMRAALAGCAVGIAVMEGFDVGAIFSLYVAAFAFFQGWIGEGSPVRRLRQAVLRVAVVALFAAFISAAALVTLIGTQVKGIVGMEQDARTKAQRWDEATQWSLPKIETLRVIIPGLFGYRMDTGDGGNYWGGVGRTVGWEQHHQGYARHSGSGEYAGVLVVLIAVWGVGQSLRKTHNPFPEQQRKCVWFWAAAAGVSLLFAWGRHAPFYHLVYALPYFSTIRNPIKFMHPFHAALMVLFAYGLHALVRRHLEGAKATTQSLKAHLKTWWITALVPDKKWTTGLIVTVATSLLAWLLYASSASELQRHLRAFGFDATNAPGLAEAIARFSRGEVGLFVVFLTLAVGLVTLALSGWFAGPRAKWAALLLGALLVLDLGRANRPWIQHFDYKAKYASNPVLDFLREKPWEGRVTVAPFQVNEQMALLQQLYGIEWHQHHFQFYKIQSLDFVQEPRRAVENDVFRQALPRTNAVTHLRLWELTNTRYVLGLVGNFSEFLSDQLDPSRRRFRVHTPFTLVQPSPGGAILAQITTNGPFALLEFTGALPRAKLYARWRVSTNGEATLKELANPDFDPQQLVLVANELPAGNTGLSTNQDAGAVTITRYGPKEIALRAQVKAPAVLLLNDKHHPAWKVRVDGQPAPLLRCNFIMRGVQLQPGEHTVEFRFQPPVVGLYVSLAAVLIGLGLVGFLLLSPQPAPPAGEAADTGGADEQSRIADRQSRTGPDPRGIRKPKAQ